METLRILIVEDEAIIAEDFKQRLETLGYHVVGIVSTGARAVEKIQKYNPDLILMDIVLKGEMDGIEAAGKIREKYDIPIIYLTAYSDEEILDRASGTGPHGYLVKPFKDREVHACIQMALSKFKLEQQVKKSRDWFSSTLKCIGEGVIVTDQNGLVTFLNKMAQEMTGWEPDDAIGRPLQDVFTVTEIDPLKTKTSKISVDRLTEYSLPSKKGEVKYLSGVLLTKQKDTIPFEDSFSAIHAENGETTGSVVVFRDITEMKKVEKERMELKARLHQAQKMEAIGTLAGGIAHDFNNLLGIILGYTDLLMEKAPESSNQQRDLGEILKAGYRAKDLIKQILSFSRGHEADSIELMPAPIVKETLKLLRASIPANVEIKENIDLHCGPILIDPSQFSQVILNLCTNAYMAIEKEYGILDVKLTQEILDKKDVNTYPETAPGLYLNLSVHDTGIGIPPEIMDRLFEPYFTTREFGKGTGLGLAIVHGIIKANNGLIKLDSEPGKGTCVQVFFPVVEKRAIEQKTEDDQLPGGTERILLVDDEPSYLKMVKTMLERLGYSIVAKDCGVDALEIFSNRPDSFDLVITDQAMPNMTGADLSEKLLQIRPDIPVVLCTGFSQTITKERAKEIGIKGYAMKPLSLKDLGKLIQKTLTTTEK